MKNRTKQSQTHSQT